MKRGVLLSARPVMALPNEGGPPSAFRILKAGPNQTEKGTFLFDAQAAEAVMTAWAAKGLDKVVIDYEHDTFKSEPGPKPAAGWCSIEVRNGELWAVNCSWTKEAAELLAPAEGAPKYRFYSPVLKFDGDTMRVTRFVNLALTNNPAMDSIDGLMAATADPDDKESDMNWEEQYKALKAKFDEMEEKCRALTARLSALEGDKTQLTATLSASQTKLCALTGQTSEAGALGVIEAWKSEAARTAQLKAEKAQAEMAALTAEVKGILDKAGTDGKIAPAERSDWESDVVRIGGGKITRDAVTWLSARVEKMTPRVSTQATSQNATQTAVLTSADLEVAKLMGTSPKELQEFKTKQIEDQALARAAQ